MDCLESISHISLSTHDFSKPIIFLKCFMFSYGFKFYIDRLFSCKTLFIWINFDNDVSSFSLILFSSTSNDFGLGSSIHLTRILIVNCFKFQMGCNFPFR